MQSIRLALLILLSGSIGHASDMAREKQLHEHLWSSVVKNFEVETRAQANSRETILTSITVLDETLEIDGQLTINVPAALSPHARNFSYLQIEGTGLDRIKSVAYTVAGGIVFTNPQLQTQRLVQIPSRLLADWNDEQQTLEIKGHGTITGLRLISLEGLSSTFDESLFNITNNSQPPIEAVLHVDPSKTLSIDGVTELPTDRFFRLYISPGADRSGMEPEFAQKGFYPGRQMVKLAHELETRHGAYTEPLLQEDPQRAGYADLSIFEQRTFDRFKHVDPKLEFAQCLNIWPNFMDAQIPGQKNTLGTPAIEAFDAAAELAAAYVADEIKDSGRTANYWEVKNESDIQHEWTYHLLSQFDGWALLGEFHNKVARALKEVSPTTQVGGPASAWPRMEMGHQPFSVWKNHAKFMDLTQADLDFYSHHFYDHGVRSSYHARSTDYEDWLQGRLDCVLDLLCAQMHRTNNIKPLLITEYGTLLGGTRDIDYWLRVSNYSSFMIQFMERPGDFALTVPFLLGYMHWEPDSGVALVRRNNAGDYEFTPNVHFLDLWENVGGEYLHLKPIHPRVHNLAWKKGSQIYIAVNNQSGQSLSLRPDLHLPQSNPIQSISYRIPTYKDGRFQLVRSTLKNAERLTIGDGETAIIVVETRQAPPTNERILQTTYYAHETALPLEKGTSLEIETPNLRRSEIQSVTLRLGLQNPQGPSGKLKGTFNGHPFSIDLEAYSAIKNFFEYVEIDLPPQKLSHTNKIRLSLRTPSTYLSHAKLTIQTRSVD